MESGYGGSSNVIVDDFQSQGYGVDSEMDAQDLLNGFGGGFVEGDSDIIDEEEGGDDHNNSMDNIRQSKKNKPKSLDDFDETEGKAEIDKEEFFKNLEEVKRPNLLKKHSDMNPLQSKYQVKKEEIFKEDEEEDDSEDSDKPTLKVNPQELNEEEEDNDSTNETKNKKRLEIETSFGSAHGKQDLDGSYHS